MPSGCASSRQNASADAPRRDVPVTPFHMGPALAFKAAAGRRFALAAFGVSQVLIDLEPLTHWLRGDRVLHGFFHGFLGASLLAVPSTALGVALAAFAVRHRTLGRDVSAWLAAWNEAAWGAAAAGAIVGAWSHVLLDGTMHADLHPFTPWSDAQPFLHAVPVPVIHGLCVGSGLAGAAALGVRSWTRGRTP